MTSKQAAILLLCASFVVQSMGPTPKLQDQVRKMIKELCDELTEDGVGLPKRLDGRDGKSITGGICANYALALGNESAGLILIHRAKAVMDLSLRTKRREKDH